MNVMGRNVYIVPITKIYSEALCTLGYNVSDVTSNGYKSVSKAMQVYGIVH